MSVDSSLEFDKISTYDSHFRKNGCQVIMGKFFEIEIFVLKYVLEHPESVPTKKKFRPKIFVVGIFRVLPRGP